MTSFTLETKRIHTVKVILNSTTYQEKSHYLHFPFDYTTNLHITYSLCSYSPQQPFHTCRFEILLIYLLSIFQI